MRFAWLVIAICLASGLCFPGAGSAQETDAQSEQNPFFDLEDFDSQPWWRLPITVHGRVDLTVWHFGDSRNVDGLDRDSVTTMNPALSLTWDITPYLQAITEIEYDGNEGEIEVDRLLMSFDLASISSKLDLGFNYVPFGVERHYYSSTTNPLVDRPSPFRRVFPGSYSDVGVFFETSHRADNGSGLTAELAITRGLRGPDREDRPDDLFDGNDDIQAVGRIGVEPIYGFELGVSGLYVAPDDVSGHGRIDLAGIDFVWRGDFHHLRFEYVGGEVARSEESGGDFRRKGWYVELYKRFPFDMPWLEALEAVVRFDSLDENSRVRDFRDVERLAVGFNWVPNNDLRLKLQYEVSDERGQEISNNAFFVQMEYHF